MDYDLIVVKTLERVYKNSYYIIRGRKDPDEQDMEANITEGKERQEHE